MKIYRVDEFHAEDDTIQYGILICALETEKEAEAYDKELWDSLLAPFGYTDDDIYYYASPDEKIEDIQKGVYGIHLEGEYQFEEDEPIVKLDDGFVVDLTMTVYLPSDGYCEATGQPLYAQSEKSAKNLAEGVLLSILQECDLQVELSAKSARTFKYKEPAGNTKDTVSEEKKVAEYIKSNNLDISQILEEMGYFQHILTGKDYVERRVKALYECEDIDLPYGCDMDVYTEMVAEYVVANNSFKEMNEKTVSMGDADDDLIDKAVMEAVDAVAPKALLQSFEHGPKKKPSNKTKDSR